MLLDLSSFGKALASLDRAAVRAQAAPEDEELRDAVIQRFEYSYELAWKMLKRHLEQVVPDPARIDGLSFRELIREGAERGIIAEPEPWFEYRHQRNLTSHAYNAAAAQLVFQTALGFRAAAHALLAELERRNAE
jgi:nucleotidyltransferase substrate binding protein (TIGR01987 family)